METFSASLVLCAGNSPVTGEFPAQRPVTRSFDVFFDLRLNKRLSKQSWGWWFETPSRSLWRHCNVYKIAAYRSPDFTDNCSQGSIYQYIHIYIYIHSQTIHIWYSRYWHNCYLQQYIISNKIHINMPALLTLMARHRTGDKPLYKPMLRCIERNKPSLAVCVGHIQIFAK